MLHVVPSTNYVKVQALYSAPESIPLYSSGILSGKYEGLILADQPNVPQCALIKHQAWCHLVGNPENTGFIQSLQTEFKSRDHLGPKTNVIYLVNPTPQWLTTIAHAVPDRQLIQVPRHIYLATNDRPFKDRDRPANFEFVRVTEALIDKVEGQLPGDLADVLKLRRSVSNSDRQALGIVAIQDRRCASWAVIDFIVGQTGEIRLFTEPDFRGQGLATAVSAATIQDGFATGLQQIEWNVAVSNKISIALAEKLGLRLERNEIEYTLIFPKVGYLINLAWHHLDQRRYEHARAVALTMIAAEEDILPRYGHFLMAAAWAGSDAVEKMWWHLREAVDVGFNDLGELNAMSELLPYHTSEQWPTVVNGVRQNMSTN